MTKIHLIAEDLLNTKIPQKELAKKYNVSISYISKVNHGVRKVEGLNYSYPIRKPGYRDNPPDENMLPGIFGLYFPQKNKWYIFASTRPIYRFWEMQSNSNNSLHREYNSRVGKILRENPEYEFAYLERCDESEFSAKLKFWINEKGGLLNTFNVSYGYSSTAIAVLKFDLDGNLVKVYDTIKMASEEEGITTYSFIGGVTFNEHYLVRADEVNKDAK